MPTRVLIVEDNHVARAFLVRVVRESFSDELAFVEASDLETARIALSTKEHGPALPGPDPYGLIMVGLELTDGSGLELLAQLGSYPAMRIATTLHSDDDLLFPALQCGADGYLFKEDRFEALVEELQKIVRGQPTITPGIARRILGFFRELNAPQHSEWDSRLQDYRATDFSSIGSSSLMPAANHASYVGIEDYQLSPRENEVLLHLSKGFTLKEIGRMMSIRWITVNEILRAVCSKLAHHSDPLAAIAASRQAMG